MKNYHKLLLAILLIIPFTGQSEETYKWVDKDGNIRYSQRNPGGTYQLDKTNTYTNEMQSDSDAKVRQEASDSIDFKRNQQQQQEQQQQQKSQKCAELENIALNGGPTGKESLIEFGAAKRRQKNALEMYQSICVGLYH